MPRSWRGCWYFNCCSSFEIQILESENVLGLPLRSDLLAIRVFPEQLPLMNLQKDFPAYLPSGEGSAKKFGSVDVTVKTVTTTADYVITTLAVGGGKVSSEMMWQHLFYYTFNLLTAPFPSPLSPTHSGMPIENVRYAKRTNCIFIHLSNVRNLNFASAPVGRLLGGAFR